MPFKIVDTLTGVVSDDGRKNTTIINTSASANMSQIKLVLNHFPPVDMGVPLLYHISGLSSSNELSIA
jgi:hypothetical protein